MICVPATRESYSATAVSCQAGFDGVNRDSFFQRVKNTAMGTIARQEHRLRTGDNIVVRSPVPDDVQALLAHRRELFDEGDFVVTLPEEYDFTDEHELEKIRQATDNPGNVLIVAETAGRIVGMLGVESRARQRLSHRATLYITVSREWRSRGVGTLLFRSAIDWAEAQPTIEQLCLAVFATNVRAIVL